MPQHQLHGLDKPCAALQKQIPNVRLIRNSELSGIRRRRCAQIRNKIGNREIGLMSHGGDHRDIRLIDRARNAFIIESPQILHRSAAASGDNQIRDMPLVGIPDRSRDLRRGFDALYTNRKQEKKLWLTVCIVLVLLILYWIFTLRKKVPAAFAVIVLILTILGGLGSLLNIFLFGHMPPFSLIDTLMASLTGLASGIAYVIALFSLVEKPAPRTVPPAYRTAAYNGPYTGNGYAPNAQSSYAQSPYAGTDPYDAPSGGYAVLGFFIPVVGLILYLVWKDQTPLRAGSAGKGALIGVIVGVVGSILLSILSVALSFGFLAAMF